MKNKLTATFILVILAFTLSLNAIAAAPVSKSNINETTRSVDLGCSTTDLIDVSDNTVYAAASTPGGFLDGVSASRIHGWAYQSGLPNTALQVHIYIINNSTGEQHIRTATADIYRADLKSAGYGDGYHGFDYSINWIDYKPGTYSVYAYAIGVNSSNALLNNAPISFTVRSMTGSVDALKSTGIGGWAWKPDAPNEPVGVHVHIIGLDGNVIKIITKSANEYRGDLATEGYGNGYHGFTIPIDWDDYGEARFRIIIYMYDGSGVSPVLKDSMYNNCKPITLLGMIDRNGIDHSSWIMDSNIQGYCQNIGCSELHRYNYAASATDRYYSCSRFIRESSYCAIATHGYKEGIQWSMRNIYNDHIDCQDENCTVCYGLYTTSDLSELPSNYFSNTRCFVSTACETAKGGESDSTNFVNVLHSKGVKTVVGFENETWYRYYYDTLQTVTTMGSPKWMIEFTRLLGEGNTVASAASQAYEITLDANLAYAGYTRNVIVNNNIPENVLTEEIYCGLNSYCIVGDKNQVVKH